MGVCGCPMVCDRSSACDNDVGSNMSCVSTSCLACGSPVAHVNPLFRTWAGLPRLGIAGPRADEKGIPRHARYEPQRHDMSYKPKDGHIVLLGW